MDDDDLMPFGQHKGVKMIDVPPHYLLFIKDNASAGARESYPQVFKYIDECEDAINKEINEKSYGTY